METNWLTKNKTIKILILLSYLIIFLLFYVFDLKWHCLFKSIFNIACPGCGLTRSINALLSFNIIGSLRYNILGIPITVFVIISSIILIKEIIKDENKLVPFLSKIVDKYYILILIIIIIVTIVNNMNGI